MIDGTVQTPKPRATMLIPPRETISADNVSLLSVLSIVC